MTCQEVIIDVQQIWCALWHCSAIFVAHLIHIHLGAKCDPLQHSFFKYQRWSHTTACRSHMLHFKTFPFPFSVHAGMFEAVQVGQNGWPTFPTFTVCSLEVEIQEQDATTLAVEFWYQTPNLTNHLQETFSFTLALVKGNVEQIESKNLLRQIQAWRPTSTEGVRAVKWTWSLMCEMKDLAPRWLSLRENPSVLWLWRRDQHILIEVKNLESLTRVYLMRSIQKFKHDFGSRKCSKAETKERESCIVQPKMTAVFHRDSR